MAKPYDLYHTLNKNISKDDDLEPKNMALMVKKIGKIEDKKKLEAIVLLITEHYRVSGGKIDATFTLPYGSKMTDEGALIDISKLPPTLRIVIWKFLTLRS